MLVAKRQASAAILIFPTFVNKAARILEQRIAKLYKKGALYAVAIKKQVDFISVSGIYKNMFDVVPQLTWKEARIGRKIAKLVALVL